MLECKRLAKCGKLGTNVEVCKRVNTRGSRILLAGMAAAILTGSTTASGQETPGCPAPPESAGASPATGMPDTASSRDTSLMHAGRGEPDVLLFASFSARTVQFRTQPRVRVRFCWGTGGDSLRVVERRNLPSPVVVGVTYRDVYVAVELLGHLNAVCLLRELRLNDIAADAMPAPGANVATCSAVSGQASAAASTTSSRAPPR